MDGVFINISNEDVIIKDRTREFTIYKNEDLITPVKEVIRSSTTLSGIVSTELTDEHIHTIQSTGVFSTVYNTITRSEQNAMMVDCTLINPYIKYPFSESQIEKINKISAGRTRLFIMSKEDAEVWSSGEFECPFRNYRIFVSHDKGLLEYPKPKTYKDTAIAFVRKIIGG